MEKAFWNKFDELVEKPYYVIDFLPKQVHENSDGQYFSVEEYYLKSPQIEKIYEKFTNILLKLNCYYDFTVYSASNDKILENPSPKNLVEEITQCTTAEYKSRSYIDIIIENENTLIILNTDNLYLTIYNPSKDIIELVKVLSNAEGVFCWQPPV